MSRKLLALALIGSSTWLGVQGCGSTIKKNVLADDAGAGGVADDLPASNGGSARSGAPSGGAAHGGNANGGAANGGATNASGGSTADAGAAGSLSAAGEAGATPSAGAGGASGGAGAAGEAGSAPVDPRCAEIPVDATLTAHLQITADNECEVFVNSESAGTTTNWGSPVTLDVSLFIHPGRRNVVAIRGTNTSSQGGNDRGIIGALKVGTSGNETELLVTDGSWRSSTTEVAGWTDLGFDDSAWPFATVIADNGAPPWGALLATPSAKWLWSAPVPSSTADKPNLETAYVRREFYFGFNGTDLSTTPGCPTP